MNSSWLYFATMIFTLGVIAGYLLLSWKSQTLNSYSVCVSGVMICILAYEFWRELHIVRTHQLFTLTYARAALLRIEQTWFGLFLAEVFSYARKNLQQN